MLKLKMKGLIELTICSINVYTLFCTSVGKSRSLVSNKEFYLATLFLIFIAPNFCLRAQPNPQDPYYIASFQAVHNETGKPLNKSEPTNSGSSGEQVGSSSFNMKIDLLDLPIRQGRMNLALNYDSGVWHRVQMNQAGEAGYLYDVLKGFPTPGFNLGFPKFVAHRWAGRMIVDSDDTRHPLTTIQPNLNPWDPANYEETYDGSYIRGLPGAYALYPDGTKIEFGARMKIGYEPSHVVSYATKITDRQGNFIDISYIGPDFVDDEWDVPNWKKISSITDNLGRVYNFHYDGEGDLIAITAPDIGTGVKQVVRFYYKTVTVAIGPGFYHTTQGPIPGWSFEQKVLNYVYFPRGQEGYRFDYSAYGYGIVHKYAKLAGMNVSNLDLQNEGSVIQDGIELSSRTYDYPQSPGALQSTPSYTHRYDDWSGRTTQQPIYTYTNNNVSGISTVTDPNGITIETLREVYPFNSPSTRDGLVTQIIKRRGAHVLNRTQFEWEEGSLENHPTLTHNARYRRTRVIETNELGARSERHFSYEGCNSFGFNNLCEEKVFDFSLDEQLGRQLGRKITNFNTQQSYKNRYIVGLVTDSSYYDESGSLIARSEVKYDEPEYPILDLGPSVGWQNPNTISRANPTTQRKWLHQTNQPDSWIETHARYDNFGNVVNAWDAKGNLSNTEYSIDSFYAFPTKVKTPIPDSTGQTGSSEGFVITTSYDFNTGLPLSTVDANGQTTQMEYVDPLFRPTRTIAPNGQQRVFEYGAGTTSLSRFTKEKIQIDETRWKENTSWFDALGRITKTQSSDSEGDIFIETQYDNIGRVKKVTNPYRAGESVFWTENFYDDLDRTYRTVLPDSSETASTYSLLTNGESLGVAETVTDQTGRKRRSVTNALGQVVRVDEPNASGQLDIGESPAQSTHYDYDNLGNLIHVLQGAQSRFFLYDSVGRLLRIRQPEQEVNLNLNTSQDIDDNVQWTASFTYDSLGSILTSTDARNITTTNTYDALGRITNRSYSNEPIGRETPSVMFYYDGEGLDQPPSYANGKLTKVSNTVSETRYKQFDNMGRLTESEQRTPVGQETVANATPRISTYNYTLSGAVVEETYPSGRVVKNEFESGGNLLGVKSQKAGTEIYRLYASNFSFNSTGGISRMRLGNGLWETARFSERMQLIEHGLGRGPEGASLWKVNYTYGELDENENVLTSQNSGNIAKQTISVPGLVTPITQLYKYDSLYRLKEAKETSTGTTPAWIQQFDYDIYGNRTSFISNIAGTSNTQTPAIDTGSNRFSSNQGFDYDESGNLIEDVDPQSLLVEEFVFNGDNRQIESKRNGVSIGMYFYDGEGKRVKKIAGNVTTVFVYSAGKIIAEYSTQLESEPSTNFLTTDHLGSTRIVTNAVGGVRVRRDYMPFGEEISPGVGLRSTNVQYGTEAGGVRRKFGGYQRDDETNLDFAEARMYGYRYGRFTAVDPLLSSGSSKNPQTFNRYVYVANNPVVRVDMNGKDWIVSTNPGKNGLYFFKDVYGNELTTALESGGFERVTFRGDYQDVFVGGVANYRMFASGNGRLLTDADRAESDLIVVPGSVEGGEDSRTGPPNGQRRIGRNRVRWYDNQGRALLDIDYHPEPNVTTSPHIHWWTWPNKDGARGDAEDKPEGWVWNDEDENGVRDWSPYFRQGIRWDLWGQPLYLVTPGRPVPGGVVPVDSPPMPSLFNQPMILPSGRPLPMGQPVLVPGNGTTFLCPVCV